MINPIATYTSVYNLYLLLPKSQIANDKYYDITYEVILEVIYPQHTSRVVRAWKLIQALRKRWTIDWNTWCLSHHVLCRGTTATRREKGDSRTICYHMHVQGCTYAVQHNEQAFWIKWLAFYLDCYSYGKMISKQWWGQGEWYAFHYYMLDAK